MQRPSWGTGDAVMIYRAESSSALLWWDGKDYRWPPAGGLTVDFEIAPATAQDAPEIAALCAQLGYPTTGEAIGGRLAGLEAASHAVFVARRGGEALAWLHVAATRALEYEPCAEILGLVVEPSARSAGIGAALVVAAEQWARRCGFNEIRVRSRDSRERAHAFYRRAGYEEWKRQVVFRKAL